jgi:glucosamine-6-phosphate deaminase
MDGNPDVGRGEGRVLQVVKTALCNVQWVYSRDVDELSREAAQLLAGVLCAEEQPVLGFATGASPLGLYRHLVRITSSDPAVREGWTRAHGFNLDEYVGLAPSHPQSYHAYMQTHLYRHVPIPPEHIHIPDGTGALDAACRNYDELLEHIGWPHVQVLGIGRNGHIGFNEPGRALNLRTHVVTLAETTRRQNARYFGSADAVPRQAVTMGIGDILRARRIVLLAFGPSKRDALQRAFSGVVTTECPASLLQLHPNVTVFTDQDVPLPGTMGRQHGTER